MVLHAVQVPGGDADVLGQRAVARVADRAPLVAMVGLPAEAVVAAAAVERRVDRHPVALAPRGPARPARLRAERGDHAAELVPVDEREVRHEVTREYAVV